MIGALLIAILALFKGDESPYNSFPCNVNSNTEAYNTFVHRHVLQEAFNTELTTEWKEYLENHDLCHRPTQSFVEKGAGDFYVNICNGSGKRRGKTNLCTSTSPVWLHELNVNTKDCSVRLRRRNRYVTVACDKVDNRCLPVHFKNSQNNRPDAKRKTCEPKTNVWFDF